MSEACQVLVSQVLEKLVIALCGLLSLRALVMQSMVSCLALLSTKVNCLRLKFPFNGLYLCDQPGKRDCLSTGFRSL